MQIFSQIKILFRLVMLACISIVLTGCTYYRFAHIDNEERLVVANFEATYYYRAKAEGVLARDFSGSFKDLSVGLIFSDRTGRLINIQLSQFELKNVDNKHWNLLNDVEERNGGVKEYSNGFLLSSHLFYSRPLPELHEGEYTIHIKGEICLDDECAEFEHIDEIELIFTKEAVFPT